DPENPGVLILSRFAGAASELTSALLVNPYDPEAVATSIAHAFSMPLDERQSRHKDLFHAVCTNDIKAWAGRFLSALPPDGLALPQRRAYRPIDVSTVA